MNKYRLSIMLVLILLVFLYMLDIVEVTPVTNLAFTFASLLFSVSSTIDTYAKGNKKEKIVSFVIDTLAIGIAVLLPSLKDEEFLEKAMTYFDSNVLLLLALFFTMSSQWATEIKQKDKKTKTRWCNNDYKKR